MRRRYQRATPIPESRTDSKKHFETEVFVRERAMRVKERSVLPMCGAFAAPRQNSSF
jgi:hypothetical protein